MNGTEENIVHTSIRLFKKQGYENTSIADICREAKITKGTFYYHFANKDDITFAYYESLYANQWESIPDLLTIENAKEQLWMLLEYSIDNTISLTPAILKAFMISDIQKGLNFFSPYKTIRSSQKRIQNHTMQINLVKRGQKNKEIKIGDPEMMLHTFTSALIGIAIDWASNDGCFDEKKELRKVFDTIF
ncbi:MAG: TetR/AcrR family transcriptional regulator [Hespellia sp.]|nr:TetR/AcrR family transcriptional regulator [Hespellia sp.]